MILTEKNYFSFELLEESYLNHKEVTLIRNERTVVTITAAAGQPQYLRTPSWFSSLLMILMSLPFSPSTARTAWTSAALRMKEAKTMSTPCSTPNCRSLTSFSETAGRSTAAPGRFTPFLLPSVPPFSISQFRKSEPDDTGERENRMRPFAALCASWTAVGLVYHWKGKFTLARLGKVWCLGVYAGALHDLNTCR